MAVGQNVNGELADSSIMWSLKLLLSVYICTSVYIGTT